MSNDIVYKAIVVPLCILVGMYVCGSFIGGALSLPNVFPGIFAAAGGIPTVGAYFYKLWKS